MSSQTSPTVPSPRSSASRSVEEEGDTVAIVVNGSSASDAQKKPEAGSGEWSAWVTVVGQVLIGLLFGFFLQKGRVYEPRVIQGQMLMQDFTMLQMFLSAVATTQFISIFSTFLPHSPHFTTWRQAYTLKKNDRGMLSTALGAGLVGVGMSLAGACPGTVMAQLGSGTSGAWIALLGGVGGVLVLAFVEGGVKKCVHPVCKVEGKGVEEVVKIPYIIAVTGSFIACTAFVVICAVVLPNSQPFTPTIVDERNILIVSAWAPWASGIAIGLLQIPTILLTQQPLGMSSGLVAILSPIATYILKPLNLISDSSEIAKWNFPSLRAFSKILNIAAVILGAFVSAVISGMVGVAPGLISGVPVEKGGPYTIGEGAGPIVQTVVGGFVMYFGARMAGGCPSGHGISGFSFLASTSVVAVPCMFAGGIATAFAVKAIAGL